MTSIKETLDNWPRTLAGIFLMALLMRVLFVSFLQDGFYFPDAISYTRAAGNLLSQGDFGEAYRRAPGYPVLLAAIQSVFGSGIFAVRLVESVIGAFLAVVIAILGRRLGGAAVGAIAGGLWSIYPIAVFVVGLVYPTSVMALLLACGAYFLVPHSQEPISLKRVFLAGLVWGIAALTVPAGLATIVLTTLWLFYWGAARRLALIAFFLLGSAASIAPWTVRNYYVHGRLVAVDARMENHLRPPDAVDASPAGKLEAIRRNPELFALNAAKEFVYFWRLYPERLGMEGRSAQERYYPDPRVVRNDRFSSDGLTTVVSIASTVPLFLFAAVGTMALWRDKKERRRLSLLWTIILSFAIGYSLFFTKMRYRVPIEPYLVILGAYGLLQTCKLFSSGSAWFGTALQTGQNRPAIKP